MSDCAIGGFQLKRYFLVLLLFAFYAPLPAIANASKTHTYYGGTVWELEETRGGKLIGVVASAHDERVFDVVRFHANGQLDHSFGSRGFAKPFTWREGGQAQGAAVSRDGRIAVVGFRRPSQHSPFPRGRSPLVAMLKPNGERDTRFGDQGRIGSFLQQRGGVMYRDAAFQPSGRLIVVGNRNGAFAGGNEGIVRAYHRNGEIDRSFGFRGTFSVDPEEDDIGSKTDFNSVLALPNGKTIVGGYIAGDLVAIRLRYDGRIDRQFGRNGLVRTDLNAFPYCDNGCNDRTSLEPGPEGSFFLAASPDGNSVSIARYGAEGDRSTGFGHRGRAIFRRADFTLSHDEAPGYRPKPTQLMLGDMDVNRSGQVALSVTGAIEPKDRHRSSRQIATTIRLGPGGRPDRSLGPNGIEFFAGGLTSFATAVAVTAKGGIWTGGSLENYANQQDLWFLTMRRTKP